MDLYRLLALSENVQGCEGRKRLHIEGLLNCACPEIKFPELSFADYAKRDPKMFFSRTRLNNYFELFIDDLLDCKCQECKAAKNADMDILWVSRMKTRVQSHPWILGFMIYLGKLHYIYYWMKWDFFNLRGELEKAILVDGLVEKELIKTKFDLPIFQEAYNRAISMFFPMDFQIQNNDLCSYRDLPDSRRFPYSEEEPISTTGFYGVMTKVEIVPEYLDESIIDLVVGRYPTSGTDAGSDRKLLFALKSVRMKSPESPLRSMERNVLDMISRIEEPASENMITLLFAYKWKDQIHFLFPFIEMNLDHVLRHKRCPRNRLPKLGRDEQLPQHWLWSEMKGVCYALSVFHKMMKSPFDDNKGIVIGLHFDLKPANILVTTEGKLKITDFGQSIIQMLGKGEDMTVPHSPGDSRYAAPESRPTLDYDKDDPEDIQVLLNYDVWSLGCIMVEVLINILGLQTLEAFDQKLAGEQNAGFFTGNDLKQCVDSSLQNLQAMFHDTPQGHYMVKVEELIRRMLSHDVKERPYSLEVFNALQEAESDLIDRSKQRDRITPAVKAYNLSDGTGFKELGWDNGQSIVSFADKAGITVELVDQRDGHREEQPRPCRIRLFRGISRQKQATVEIALVWGVDRGGKVDVKQKRVELSRWCFSPTYLFRDDANSNERFECRLFPIMGLPGERMSYDLAFIFQFESLEDVLLFQGTLLKKAIFPSIRASVKGIVPKRPRGLSWEQREPPASNQKPSHIQLWADDKPRHYKPVGLSLNGRRSTAASDSSSIPPNRTAGKPNIEQSKTMVIFLEGLSPLVIAVNNGHKVFKNGGNFAGKHCVHIVNDIVAKHKSYLVTQLPPQPAWQSQNLNEKPHASSSIFLEADCQKIPGVDNKDFFKVEGMKILLESEDDFKRLRRGTSSEWEED
ncbi:kinase-like domain-containing protein [Fusarium venenatum]|uniref:kinase-like domain-containing protein n=1 Tax=Fusarium venenatum TaxID=56646 RepID=UPI001D9E544E|nr:kinase-like domain-containing protein [Fusarium venenatum]